jgi:hypothetical protein
LQQAGKAIEGLGVFSLEKVISTDIWFIQMESDWGMGNEKMDAIRGAKISQAPIYISRQSLRLALLEQLGGHDAISGHQLVILRSQAKLLN